MTGVRPDSGSRIVSNCMSVQTLLAVFLPQKLAGDTFLTQLYMDFSPARIFQRAGPTVTFSDTTDWRVGVLTSAHWLIWRKDGPILKRNLKTSWVLRITILLFAYLFPQDVGGGYKFH